MTDTPEAVSDLRAKIARWSREGGGWDVCQMAELIGDLVSELDELDVMADRYATANGGYCGNARGVLTTLLERK